MLFNKPSGRKVFFTHFKRSAIIEKHPNWWWKKGTWKVYPDKLQSEREQTTENGAKDQKAAHVLEEKQSVMIVTREKMVFLGFCILLSGDCWDVVIIVDEME